MSDVTIELDYSDFDKKVMAYMKDELKTAQRAILNVYADEAVLRAAEVCPVDTGDLRSTIRKIESVSKPDEEIFITAGNYLGRGGLGQHSNRVGGKKKVEYALEVHEGTSKMSPRPFLRTGAIYATKLVKQSELKRAFFGKGVKNY